MQMEPAGPTLLAEPIRPLKGGSAYCPTGTIVAEPFAAALGGGDGCRGDPYRAPRQGRRLASGRVPYRGSQRGSGSQFLGSRIIAICTTPPWTSAQPRGVKSSSKLVERADIWMESSKARTYDKWGTG